MSFFRHAEIYRSDVIQPMQVPRSSPATAPRSHRLDEFPAGYSLAGCSPAEPASASPTTRSMRYVVLAGNGLSANGNLSLIYVSQGKGAVHIVPNRAAPNTTSPLSVDVAACPRLATCRILRFPALSNSHPCSYRFSARCRPPARDFRYCRFAPSAPGSVKS